ncbi:YfiR family protein, partial [Candidatus Marithioploca araucensis]|nr:YfiR family protein [Candidatus Marithioploca araucensis]
AQEYQVKAVFLYNFANFIRWPKSAFANRYAPFNSCILGDDPFGKEIDVTVDNEKVNGHHVKIQRLVNMKKIDVCQILFISAFKKSQLSDILTFLKRYPILTVSDSDNFVIQGGMIQFFKQGKQVRFYIAPEIVKKVGLQISANLLRIADIVHRQK